MENESKEKKGKLTKILSIIGKGVKKAGKWVCVNGKWVLKTGANKGLELGKQVGKPIVDRVLKEYKKLTTGPVKCEWNGKGLPKLKDIDQNSEVASMIENGVKDEIIKIKEIDMQKIDIKKLLSEDVRAAARFIACYEAKLREKMKDIYNNEQRMSKINEEYKLVKPEEKENMKLEDIEQNYKSKSRGETSGFLQRKLKMTEKVAKAIETAKKEENKIVLVNVISNGKKEKEELFKFLQINEENEKDELELLKAAKTIKKLNNVKTYQDLQEIKEKGQDLWKKYYNKCEEGAKKINEEVKLENKDEKQNENEQLVGSINDDSSEN